MSTIAFVGLGAMGSRMARNLLAAGHQLRVYNRDPAKTQPLAELGAQVCTSAAEAVQNAAFAIAMVADDDATRAVMLGAAGLVSAAAPGTILIDCSTITPAMAREVAQAAVAKGVQYLDAPVLGSLAQAQGRELVFLAGGEPAAFEIAQPVFAAMGRLARRVGPSGSGATLKLVNNMLSGSAAAALAEAARVVEAADIDRAAALEILGEGAAGSRLMKTKLPKMFNRDFSPQFQLELMDKDLRYFLNLARELDQLAPLATSARSQYETACRNGLGKLDFCAVYLQKGTDDNP